MRWTMRVVRMVITILMVSLISSLLTVGTTAIVVDQYIQTALNTFHIPLERKPLTLTSMWGVLLGSGAATDPTKASGSVTGGVQPAGERGDAGDTESGEAGGAGGGSSTGNQSKPDPNAAAGEPSDGALPVMGGISSGQEARQQERVVVPPDVLSKNKDDMSKTKKEELFTALMKKLPQEEWQHLSTLMEDGLTSSELTEVEQILAKHLNDEEYKQMREWLVGESGTAIKEDGGSGAAAQNTQEVEPGSGPEASSRLGPESGQDTGQD
ncbi:spore coat protein [Paenibacillus sp. MER TA 81-3]|uniref:spore coat protein n=1 Tax=Paenibacillus sp. MER TA 81-3 TaxID=2939573 RepID=UPI00203AB941|nr:spore coat protein [Paenibacillus sp. MER TA 81-3]MCM3340983.1 spore coat protein [Paenibacillus sp. MER TA 81-3]